MVQTAKIKTVEATTERLERSQSVVVCKYPGLTVADMTNLRNRLREQGSELKVVKNRLIKRALRAAGFDALDEYLIGPTALAFGYQDPTSPARVCAEFAKGNQKLQIRGGLLGRSRIDAQKIGALAALPGRPELLTQMAATMLAPMRMMATAMNQAMAKIVYAMKSRADQMGEAPAPSQEPPLAAPA
jgi:large subunit ribosomal protein L10